MKIKIRIKIKMDPFQIHRQQLIIGTWVTQIGV